MTTNQKGALLALTAFAVFAGHDVIVKTLGQTYAPVQIVFFSVLLSFPLATLMLLRDPTRDTLFPHHPGWVAVRTASAVLTAVCAFYAFSVLPLAQTYAILFAAPLLVTILSIPILGEKVRLQRWAAVIVGLIGVMIVLRPGSTELSLGHAAALVAAIGSALGSVIVRRIGKEERAVVILLYPLVANFLVMGAALPFYYRPMPLADLGLLAVVAALAWTATRLTIAAYRSADAVLVAPMQYSQILWASAYGLIFFDENLDGATVLGAAVIIGSGLFILFRESRASTHRPNLETRTRAGIPGVPRISGLMGLPGRGGFRRPPEPLD